MVGEDVLREDLCSSLQPGAGAEHHEGALTAALQPDALEVRPACRLRDELPRAGRASEEDSVHVSVEREGLACDLACPWDYVQDSLRDARLVGQPPQLQRAEGAPAANRR